MWGERICYLPIWPEQRFEVQQLALGEPFFMEVFWEGLHLDYCSSPWLLSWSKPLTTVLTCIFNHRPWITDTGFLTNKTKEKASSLSTNGCSHHETRLEIKRSEATQNVYGVFSVTWCPSLSRVCGYSYRWWNLDWRTGCGRRAGGRGGPFCVKCQFTSGSTDF